MKNSQQRSCSFAVLSLLTSFNFVFSTVYEVRLHCVLDSSHHCKRAAKRVLAHRGKKKRETEKLIVTESKSLSLYRKEKDVRTD